MRVFGAVLEQLTQISLFDGLLMALACLSGIILGWLIWGGQKRQIEELEDALASTGARMRNIIVDDEGTSTTTKSALDQQNKLDFKDSPDPESVTLDDDTKDNDTQNRGVPDIDEADRRPSTLGGGGARDSQKMPAIFSKPDGSLRSDGKIYDDGNLRKLREELAIIRTLINNQPDVEPLKEYLDQSDDSLKRANGRLELLLRAVEKGDK